MLFGLVLFLKTKNIALANVCFPKQLRMNACLFVCFVLLAKDVC